MPLAWGTIIILFKWEREWVSVFLVTLLAYDLQWRQHFEELTWKKPNKLALPRFLELLSSKNGIILRRQLSELRCWPGGSIANPEPVYVHSHVCVYVGAVYVVRLTQVDRV